MSGYEHSAQMRASLICTFLENAHIAHMESTPKAAKVLANCLLLHGWTQTEVAKASATAIPTVCAHLAGRRAIRDDHLAAYLPCLDRVEQRQLVAAWLQDVLPPLVQESVLDPASHHLQEEVTTYALGLTQEQQSMLRFWAEKLAADDELDHIFTAISRKAGWKL
jgi:hypothetical protein